MRILVVLSMIVAILCCLGCGKNSSEGNTGGTNISILQNNKEYVIENSSEMLFNQECLDGLSRNELAEVKDYLSKKVNENDDIEVGTKKEIKTFDDFVDTWMLYKLSSIRPFYDQAIFKCEISKIGGDEYRQVLPYIDKCKKKFRIDVTGFTDDIFKVEMTLFSPCADNEGINEADKKYLRLYNDGSCEGTFTGYYLGVYYLDRIALESIGPVQVKTDKNNILYFNDESPIMGDGNSGNYYGNAISLMYTGDEKEYSELKGHVREKYNLEYLRMFIRYQENHGLNVNEEKAVDVDRPLPKGAPVPPTPPKLPVPVLPPGVEQKPQNFTEKELAAKAWGEFLHNIYARKYDEAYGCLTPEYQNRLQSPNTLKEKYDDTYFCYSKINSEVYIENSNRTEASFEVEAERYYFKDFTLYGRDIRFDVVVKKINDRWLVDSISPELTANP